MGAWFWIVLIVVVAAAAVWLGRRGAFGRGYSDDHQVIETPTGTDRPHQKPATAVEARLSTRPRGARPSGPVRRTRPAVP